MKQLNKTLITALPNHVALPGYDRECHDFGIVHLGLGAFHRAHQACYTDSAMASSGGDWRICGVSLCTPAARDQLTPQDYLFTVIEKSDQTPTCRLVGSIGDVIFAPEERDRLFEYLIGSNIRIVSLTITEKGYLHDPATGRLDQSDPAIKLDLDNPGKPKTAVGLLVNGLAERRRRGMAPFTLLSCDNLPENGQLLRNVLTDFAGLLDDDLAAWIEKEVSFPCTMVDRIVPSTLESDRQFAAELLGVRDEATVFTEPFSQWVLEDCFPLGRPDWETGGAIFSNEVKSFEIMKLRLLNGAHSLLAYLGSLAGMTSVSACMQWTPLKTLCEHMMRNEILPTIQVPAGYDAQHYISALLERFANPGLNHELRKIAMDGSQKLPPRWLEAIRQQLNGDRKIDLLCLGVAAWMRYICGVDEEGEELEVSDPMALDFTDHVASFRQQPEETVRRLLGITKIFGDDLRENHLFCNRVINAFRSLCTLGTEKTIIEYVRRLGA